MAGNFAGRNEHARRQTIWDLLLAGIRTVNIVALTGYSKTTVKRVRQRMANGQSLDRRPGSGSFRRTSAIGRDHVEATARLHCRWTSRQIARSLANAVPDEAVASRTVRRILHELNFKYGRMWKKFKLTQRHCKNREVWCLLHQDDEWDTTLFLDESCFAATPNGVYCWFPSAPRAPMLAAESYPAKVHVLGAISSVGTVGPLVFAPAGQAWNAQHVIAAINDHILPLAGAWFGQGQFRTQLDNARPHTANATQAFGQAAGVNLLFQPANSPDLQPIENVWGLLKRRIAQRDDIVTAAHLRQALEEEWARLTAEDVAPFVASMPRRLEECLDNRGTQTHY